MMSSCCTLRLKRRRAFSRDSLSWMMTSATVVIHPQSGLDWTLCGVSRWYTPPLKIIARGRWHLLINKGYRSQAIFMQGGELGAGEGADVTRWVTPQS